MGPGRHRRELNTVRCESRTDSIGRSVLPMDGTPFALAWVEEDWEPQMKGRDGSRGRVDRDEQYRFCSSESRDTKGLGSVNERIKGRRVGSTSVAAM